MGQDKNKKVGFDRKHLIVMALGNIIGSGIFLASGAVISVAGPSAIIAYAIGGAIMMLEVLFITEMSIVNPAPGSFRVHATEVFGNGVGFVNGWMFWCSGVLGMAGEVTAAAIFSSFWFPQIPLWIFCIIYTLLMTCVNFLDVRGLSKIEMWLASTKVLTLVIFIVFGLFVLSGVLPFELKGISANFQSIEGFMPGGIKGVLASMLLVLFSYTGTGIIGLAIAETNQPEKNVPSAVYIITFSINILYVLSILFILLMSPWKGISSAESPFVLIMQSMGIAFGGTIVNFIVLTASLSGLNSAMYSASRMLYSLGRDKQAPSFFERKNKLGVPYFAVGISSLVLIFTAVLSYMVPDKVFLILTGASGFTAMLNWLTISVTHLFYRRKVMRECPQKLKYRVRGYPYVSILAILLITAILLTSPLFPGQILSLLGGISLIVVLALIYIVLKYMKVVK
ncbi:MAG: amino acid permease [Clostridia bacterium]|nr:amino acid permease [Clostridia bacterium]